MTRRFLAKPARMASGMARSNVIRIDVGTCGSIRRSRHFKIAIDTEHCPADTFHVGKTGGFLPLGSMAGGSSSILEVSDAPETRFAACCGWGLG